jgi:hypothetical protein
VQAGVAAVRCVLSFNGKLVRADAVSRCEGWSENRVRFR